MAKAETTASKMTFISKTVNITYMQIILDGAASDSPCDRRAFKLEREA